jgi:cytochrome c peroxidase
MKGLGHFRYGVFLRALLVAMFGLLNARGAALAKDSRTIPKLDVHSDPNGLFATYQPSGPSSEKNAFFQSLGTNGRACVTCHQPGDAWTISVAHIQRRFIETLGTDPLFAPIDGANCNDTNDSSLLLGHGLIRVFLPISPVTASGNVPEFQVESIDDPYNCQLSNAAAQEACAEANGAGFTCLSVYRRPLPSTNLRFLTTVMIDGREPNPAVVGITPALKHQAMDATLGHAQAAVPPTDDQLKQIVNFELGLFTAQIKDKVAGELHADGATGGPKTISGLPFFFGINDSLSPGFDPEVFTFFTAWESLRGRSPRVLARESVARGEEIFNTRTFQINSVGGLNPNGPAIMGTCTTCHDTPNVGNHSLSLPLDIGISDPNNAVLNSGAYLPVFHLKCISGALNGHTFDTTDPGRGLVTGKCADISTVKGPILHGLAARAPYFHNGSAASLADAVNFYDQRFSIGLSDQDKADLVAFLLSL